MMESYTSVKMHLFLQLLGLVGAAVTAAMQGRL